MQEADGRDGGAGPKWMKPMNGREDHCHEDYTP